VSWEVSPEGLRGWAKQARVDAGGGTPSSLTSAERGELPALRRRVREQDQVIGILKKQTLIDPCLGPYDRVGAAGTGGCSTRRAGLCSIKPWRTATWSAARRVA
jgi:hypothetical protein